MCVNPYYYDKKPGHRADNSFVFVQEFSILQFFVKFELLSFEFEILFKLLPFEFEFLLFQV